MTGGGVGVTITSTSDLIQERLDNLQEITLKNSDHSSIFEKLQEKTKELIQVKEKAIELNTQLRIAHQTIELQNAEFSVQRNEYEETIIKLQRNESELRGRLHQLQDDIEKNAYTYEVQVKIEDYQKKLDGTNNKYMKWKERCKDLRKQIKDIKDRSDTNNNDNKNRVDPAQEEMSLKVTQIKEQLDIRSRDYVALSEQLSNTKDLLEASQKERTEMTELLKEFNRKNDENEREFKLRSEAMQFKINELHEQNVLLKQENDALIRKNKKMSLKNDNLEDVVKQIKSANQEFHIKDLHARLEEAKEENVKVRNRVQDLKNALMESKKIIDNVEVQKNTLCLILGVQEDPVGKTWKHLKSKCEELAESIRVINGLQAQNNKMKTRLDALIEEAKNSKAFERRVNLLESEHVKSKALETQNQKLIEDNEQKRAIIARYRMRRSFSRMIEDQCLQIGKNINDLYSSISRIPSTYLKSIVLCIIFAKRFFKLPTLDCPTDIGALHVFASISTLTVDQKIGDIRKRFTELTNELLEAKQTTVDYAEKLVVSNRELDELKSKITQSSKDYDDNKKRTEEINARLTNLQQELSSLVPKEDYIDILEKNRELVRVNDDISERIQKISSEYEEKVESEHAQKQLRESLEAKIVQKEGLITQYVNNMESKDKHISELNSLLREKTKEILALERIVQKYRDNESKVSVAYTRLAVENQNLHEKMNGETQVVRQPVSPVNNEKIIGSAINPTFLGR